MWIAVCWYRIGDSATERLANDRSAATRGPRAFGRLRGPAMDMPSDEARQPQKDTTSVPLDKLALEHYLRWYDRHVFRPFADQPIKLLEIGVAKGDSMLFLRDRLPKATIVGLDIKLPEGFHDDSGRVHLYQGEQQDTELLDRLAREQAPNGF